VLVLIPENATSSLRPGVLIGGKGESRHAIKVETLFYGYNGREWSFALTFIKGTEVERRSPRGEKKV